MKRYKSHQSPHEILEKGLTRLPNLLAKAQQLNELNKILTVILTEKMLPHCRVGYCDKNSVVIFSDNASCTTHIHFHAKEMAKQFQACGYKHIKNVRCKTRPISVPKQAAETSIHREISDNTRKLLEETALGLEDPKLSNALKNIAKRTK